VVDLEATGSFTSSAGAPPAEAPFEIAAGDVEPEPEADPAPAFAARVSSEPPDAPTGRALADLYYAQGHYAEALQIYDDLVTRHPFDEDLKRMRRDAEARLLPAASTPAAASQDPALERRLARVRVLKQWLGRIQTPEGPAAPGP
jgi:thioredoxin-like negative regulator of GroEL